VLVLLYESTAAAGLPLTKLEMAEAPPRLVVEDVRALIDVAAYSVTAGASTAAAAFFF
jgi:hypothetical protein